MQTSSTNAAKSERDRLAAITALPEAKGREGLAMNLATTTSLSVDQVRTALASAPLSAATVSAMWSASLASRGMKVDAVASNASADGALWDAVLERKGFALKGA